MTTVRLNHAGMGAFLRSPQMEAAMARLAERAKTYGEAISPVDTSSPHAGRYRASWEVESGTRGGVKKDRAYARVKNTAPEAAFVEFGTVHNDAHHTVARSVDGMKG